MNTNIYLGEDLPIEFTLIDDNYNPIDISTLVNIIIYLYDSVTGTVYNKYSKEAMTGYGNIITGYDDANGRCKIIVETVDTLKFAEGELMAEVMVKIPDSQFSDNNYKTVAKDLLIGTVMPSLTKNE